MTGGQSVTGRAYAGGMIFESAGFWRPAPGAATVAVASEGPGEVRFALHSPIPNPAPGGAMILYSIPSAGPGSGRVSIRVIDIAGRVVRVLVSGAVEPGVHTVSWNGLDASGARCGAGIYFIELAAGSMRGVRRVALLR
jgi:FlgD Ig-like domain